MKTLKIFLILFFLPISIFDCFGQSLNYPPTKKLPTFETYFNIKIRDDYKWLENTEDENVKDWIDLQDNFLNKYLNQEVNLKQIKTKVEGYYDTGDIYGTPLKHANHYYYQIWKEKNSNPFFYKHNIHNGEKVILIDFNKELTENENFSLNSFSIDPNGKYLVVFITKGQHLYGKLKIYNLKARKWLSKEIDGVNSSNIAWTTSNGFFYTNYGNSKELNGVSSKLKTKIKFCNLGAFDDEDKTVPFGINNNSDIPTLLVLNSSYDHNHIIVESRQGEGNKSKIFLINSTNFKITTLMENANNNYSFIGSRKNKYFFYTDNGSSKGKIEEITVGSDSKGNWETIIPESKETLAGGSTAGGNAMKLIGDHLVLIYREGMQTILRAFDLQGNLEFEIPIESGWIGSGIIGGNNGDEAFFTLSTFLSPSSVIRVDLENGNKTTFFNQNLSVQQNNYVSINTYYKSFDGTKVPLFICHKKGILKDKNNPVFIYGYGMGGWVATPWYQPNLLTFLDMGGIYILPGIRGGGEYGDSWHKEGINLKRKNAIGDYIAAAEFMINQDYTQPGRIIANGWSASGSLAAIAYLRRPDLFGAALIGIPSLDLLRYEQFTPFKGWTRGYGSVNVKEEFLNLYKWSPYHNIKNNTCYPPIMLTVGEKDQVTPPQHGYKFVAVMQDYQKNCAGAVLLNTVKGAGHSFGVDMNQVIDTQSKELLFLENFINSWSKEEKLLKQR